MTLLPLYQERRIRMEGASNVRDLGGYPTSFGRHVRRGVFFRADSLHRLTERDQEELVGRGVRSVIDLRHARELQESENVFASSGRLAYHNVSLFNPADTATTDLGRLGDLYVDMLENRRQPLLRVFELLSADPREAVLFHCAAGKDRTGVIAALLLELAGVAHEVIVADYAMTAACLTPLMEELRRTRPESVSAELYERFLGAEPEEMEKMLAHLAGRYDGAEEYLMSIGLAPEQVEGLKKKLLGA
ncbi:tyrosine-protein phosphatase [Cohnella zeiphila]|uniref:Tyrosine-protein phosphatase n=1 Tax=Cohnella zeiphila TaxID=2761120 RepID=A0A7X0SN19_9BACL|nr:tyrosine-protein phosphatase [Cohnella zeiphila]MBB6730758.1 tyrosine-protein phosphatase [Cohnella zeiphila]